MRLLHKLILTFTVLAFVPLLLMAGILLGGQRARLMKASRERVHALAVSAARQLDLLLDRTIEQAGQLARSDCLVRELAEANGQYAALDEAAVRELMEARDRQWRTSPGEQQPEIVRQALANMAAAKLREFQQSAPERFAEILLTDGAGGLHAATNPATDYYQADEGWWQKASDEGRGQIVVGQVAYDESAGVFSLDVAAPVRDAAGTVIGVLKISHDVNSVFQIVQRLRTGQTGGGLLLDARGTTIFNTERGTAAEQFDADAMRTIRSQPDGVFVGTLGASRDDQVIGFALLSSTGAVGTVKVPSGPWFVTVNQSAAEVYAPSRRSLLLSALVLLVPLAGLLLLALYLRTTLLAPIRALYWTADQVSAGRLDVRVEIGSGDELEEVGYQFNRMAAALQRHEEDQRRELRRRTDELRQTDLQARRVRDAMSAQMHSISHGLSDLLADMHTLSEGQGEPQPSAEEVRAMCRAVDALAEDLHDLYEVEGGQMRLQLTEVDLPACLESARRVLGPLMERYEVSLKLPQLGPGCSVVADRAKLKQVLYVLLSNAVKHGGRGSTATVSVEPTGGRTVVGVHDRGPGIPPNLRDAIFDPPLTHTPMPWAPGDRVGLNLPIARQLVQLHGGEIWVEGERGEGAVFYFSLPDRDAPAQQAEPQA